MSRRATPALTTCLGACLGVNKAQLKRLRGAWGVYPLVPTRVLLVPQCQSRCRREPTQPQALQTLGSSLVRIGSCLCVCASVLS